MTTAAAPGTEPGTCSGKDPRASGANLPPPPPLTDTTGLSLFLDFDGTLVDIAERPEGVVVPPTLPETLAVLAQRLEGRLALVSGRSLAALDDLLGPVGLPMAGSHGGEFRPSADHEATPLADALPASVVSELEEIARDHGDLIVETKPCSAAIHYRLNPDMGPSVASQAARVASTHGLRAKHGKMVVELSMPGSDKGNAVARFMEGPPFLGSRPVFVGDDVTDEDAFAMIRRLGGEGILVGPMRPTLAHWRLENVAAVHRWLESS